jgi:UDP-N-acetylmuramoyl-tripeptide--D-alanyl-D-alanine ligase
MMGARGTAFRWDDGRVREALGLPPGEDGPAFTGVSTDSRSLRPGELFVALEGPTFDGHSFLDAAQAGGAAGAVVRQGVGGLPAEGLPLYPVENTLEALGSLARYRRRALEARVVGITGSSGKTTAKELLAAVLATAFSVHATRGNLNNRVGVPLTLLAAPDEAGVLVLELGTNEPGEIAALTGITEPDTGLVTTVSESHLEGLGDLEGVLEEKLDLLRGLRPGGAGVVGDEPATLAERSRRMSLPVRVVGLSDGADPEWRGELLDMDEEGRWRVRLPAGTFRCGIPGRHGVRNALLALAAGDLLGVPVEEGLAAVEGARAGKLRGEVLRLGDLTLVVDCYNANPQSTRAAVELLADLPAAGGRVAVLGSMLELGPGSAALHRQVLEAARALPLRLVVGVGAFADQVRTLAPGTGETGGGGPELLGAATPEEAWMVLRPRLSGNETVLLKASRGVALERLLPAFQASFGANAHETNAPMDAQAHRGDA